MTNGMREMVRVARLFFGLFLYAVGIVMTVHANLGAAPWDVFHLGVAGNLGITLGVANVGTSAIIVLASALMREHVGFGTICNMVAIGSFIDLLIFWGCIPIVQTLPAGVALLIGGLFMIALASVFYMGAGYGAGPRDSLMVALAKRTGRSAGLCRCCVEGTVLFFGWLLGGPVGVGTLLSAAGIGFAVQIVFGLLRFDVKKIRQESLLETYRRFLSALRPRRSA